MSGDISMSIHKDFISFNGCIIFHVTKILKYVIYNSPFDGHLDYFQYFKIIRQYPGKNINQDSIVEMKFLNLRIESFNFLVYITKLAH